MIVSSDSAQYYNFIHLLYSFFYIYKVSSINFVRIAAIQEVRIRVK